MAVETAVQEGVAGTGLAVGNLVLAHEEASSVADVFGKADPASPDVEVAETRLVLAAFALKSREDAGVDTDRPNAVTAAAIVNGQGLSVAITDFRRAGSRYARRKPARNQGANCLTTQDRKRVRFGILVVSRPIARVQDVGSPTCVGTIVPEGGKTTGSAS